MRILIFSCSLNPESRSFVLAQEAEGIIREQNHEVTFIDMRKAPLPFCDGEAVDPMAIQPYLEPIRLADAILMAVPIYNYDVNAAAKNLIELTGSVWENKIVGFLCAAGGQGSYMSIMSLANSLMLDFRCLIVPRFVYASGDSFEGEKLASEKIRQRIHQVCREILHLADRLKAPLA